MSFTYSIPNLSELRNFSAVGPKVKVHSNSGSLYFPFPSKLTKSSSGLNPSSSSSSIEVEDYGKPVISNHPLLNPGSTKLISSPYPGPFSVSHIFPVTGSKSNPKLFRIPYA
jgi:hypothetical protein